MKIGELISRCRACEYTAPPGPEESWTAQQIVDHALASAVGNVIFVRAIIVVCATYPLSKIVIKMLLTAYLERYGLQAQRAAAAAAPVNP